MAFKSMRAGNWGVMVMDHEGNNQTQINTHPADDWNPVWSLYGKKVALVSLRSSERDLHLSFWMMVAFFVYPYFRAHLCRCLSV